MGLAVRAARFGGDTDRHSTPAVINDALVQEWSMVVFTRSVGGVIVGVSAVIFVGGARAARVLPIAFSLALVARYACLPCTLALANYCGHDCYVIIYRKANGYGPGYWQEH